MARQTPPSTLDEKLAQLEELREEARTVDPAKLEKRHAQGRYTARERIEKLLDEGSFQELDMFVRHRTPAEIQAAESAPLASLPDPQPDGKRVKKPEWLVVIGVCTHLGCIPLGHEGEFEGWFCPCHGSTYDTSGRIRSGPAPTNLEVPEYAFLTDTKIKIG